MWKCRACGRPVAPDRAFHSFDRMFSGTHPYRLVECPACRSLSVIDTVDSAQAYPPNYYTHSENASASGGVMHRAVVRAWKRLTNPAETRWLRELESRAERGHRLLDVGCGVGNLLRVAAHWGYDVYGVEPGNGAQVARANGFAVQQCRFEDATFSPD